jgi:hypothetical protein
MVDGQYTFYSCPSARPPSQFELPVYFVRLAVITNMLTMFGVTLVSARGHTHACAHLCMSAHSGSCVSVHISEMILVQNQLTVPLMSPKTNNCKTRGDSSHLEHNRKFDSGRSKHTEQDKTMAVFPLSQCQSVYLYGLQRCASLHQGHSH